MSKVDFSKLKELGKMDIKDIGKLFSKSKSESLSVKSENSIKEKFKKSKSVVAMDIGSNTIKIVVGKYFKDKLSIAKLIDLPTPEGAIIDGKVSNKQVLADMIQFSLKDNGIRVKDAICTTNSSLIINRDIVIPKVEEEEMETVIRYEIQQYLPINLDDYIIQFIVLDEIIDDVGAKLKVNVISYPERMAYGYYELLTSIELNPYILDVTYNSLNKLANYSEGTNGEVLGGTVAFVDMGATSINVTIFKNGKLDFTRMIKSGGDNIDYALSQSLNMSAKSTESIKVEKANLIDIQDEDAINKTIKQVIDDILDELERILQFYRNKTVGNNIDKIFIYGGSSNIKGIAPYMEEKLNIAIEKITDLKNVEIASKAINEEPIGEYLNAIGSIIRL
ncbi:hypothetical protein JCM1393_15910 [Clostridium carnis]